MDTLSKITEVLNNEYVAITLAIMLTSYGALTRIALPAPLVDLFKNSVFRVLFLSVLLIFKANASPHVALTVALIFIFSMQYIFKVEEFEQMENIARKNKTA